ncbi:caspase family protein [Actinosynnema sp. NPDC020468]|uniref:caspase, EACC1-associated type n=1 Tax=Actinosynnema sp. NPDC020468 TaxID=3154488 RepID=UPI0033FA3CBA
MHHLPDRERSYAVLVGTSRHTSAELPELRAVATGLVDLEACLTHREHGAWAPGQCVSITNPTDVGHLYLTVQRYARAAEDTLLLYYAGHGLLGRGGELYLALETTNPDALPVTTLPLSTLQELFAESPAARKILVVDCCFSGRALTTADLATLGAREISGTYVLTSVTTNATARSPRDARHTEFTGELIDLLRHGEPGGPELLTLASAYDTLVERMRAKDLPIPHKTGTGTIEHLALGRNAAFRAEPDGCAPLLRHELVALTALCRELPLSLVFDLHRRVVGRWGPPPDAVDAAGVLERLCEVLARPHDVPPVLRFALWVAHTRAGTPLGGLVDQWADGVADRLRLGAEGMRASRRVIAAEADRLPRRHRLVVRLDAVPVLRKDDDRHYYLSLRLHRDEDEGEAHGHPDEDRPLSIDAVRDRVRAELPVVLRGRPADRVTVEFVVPRDLLDHAFDQWPGHAGDVLGVLHTVVVCDGERPDRADPEHPWRSRWELAQNAVGAVEWLSGNGNRSASATRAALLRRGDWACLALDAAAERGSVGRLLGPGLDLGAPVAVWHRAGARDPLRDVLAGTPTAALPDRVLDLRREAVERDEHEHSGRHLGLLWDEPRRPPEPDTALAAPPQGVPPA